MQDKIISLLKKKKDKYLSGQEISKKLKISRAGIWKHIRQFRKEGYSINASPHLGYKLAGLPDKILPEEIQYRLGTKILGKKILHYDSVSSTMDIAFKLGLDGAEEGTVICAETQTKGKGRLGRNWISPKSKGIYISIILRPKISPMDSTQLILLSAIAVAEAIQELYDVAISIKWPNDVMVNNKKCVGILTEMNAEMDSVKFIVIGIGINVNTSKGILPENATSLKIETNKDVSRIYLVQEVLRKMEEWYEIIKKDGFSRVIYRWKQLSSTIGKNIKFSDTSGIIEGKAIDIDDYGGLLIRTKNGYITRKISGDVFER